jgi:hypothetical protein
MRAVSLWDSIANLPLREVLYRTVESNAQLLTKGIFRVKQTCSISELEFILDRIISMLKENEELANLVRYFAKTTPSSALLTSV